MHDGGSSKVHAGLPLLSVQSERAVQGSNNLVDETLVCATSTGQSEAIPHQKMLSVAAKLTTASFKLPTSHAEAGSTVLDSY